MNWLCQSLPGKDARPVFMPASGFFQKLNMIFRKSGDAGKSYLLSFLCGNSKREEII
jgi:hypothetical protein